MLGYERFEKLVELASQFQIVRDRLYLVHGSDMREVPSPRKRRSILIDLHEVGGHVGITKLFNMCRQYYFWPNMFRDCQQVAKDCVDCKRLKGVLMYKPLKPTYKFSQPFQCWSIDFLPRLPTTVEGYKHIMIAVDVFSKWVELFPMRSKSSEEVWEVLYS